MLWLSDALMITNVCQEIRYRARHLTTSLAKHPVAFFSLTSAVFGFALLIAAPPLRGPDETAHFLRAYGIGMGDFVPRKADPQGRKGIEVRQSFYRQFQVFDAWQRSDARRDNFSYHRVFQEYWEANRGEAPSGLSFVPYEGSEGYSPAAYIPHALAAAAANGAGWGFLETIYLMRAAGLLAMTAVLAAAIALSPTLKWAFVAVAMLPSALYGRAVINADAASLAFTLLAVALFLRTAAPGQKSGPLARSISYLLSALAKPPNLAFTLLELFSHRQGRRAVLNFLLAGAPALIGAATWTFLSSADAGTWRLVELTGTPAQQFSPAWKLGYLLKHPTAFFEALVGWFATTDLIEFGKQILGVLGLFDTSLRTWIYIAIGLLLVAVFFSPLGLPDRRRCVAGALICAAGYSCAIFLILYLVWTPVDADMIWGVQGRYFVPALPLIAIAIAGTVNRGFSDALRSFMVVLLSLLSVAGSLDAILRTDWNF